MSMLANIAAHYMAEGKRVLITCKSSEALNVIRDKIAGRDGVFEDSSPLRKLIISWGDKKEAFKRFSEAAHVLTENCGEGAGQDKEMEYNIAGRKRLSSKIVDIENDFQNNSPPSFITAFQNNNIPTSVLARINITEKKTSFISEPRRYFGPIDLTRIQIRLLDVYGRIIDMNGADYSFCLLLNSVYDF